MKSVVLSQKNNKLIYLISKDGRFLCLCGLIERPSPSCIEPFAAGPRRIGDLLPIVFPVCGRRKKTCVARCPTAFRHCLLIEFLPFRMPCLFSDYVYSVIENFVPYAICFSKHSFLPTRAFPVWIKSSLLGNLLSNICTAHT